MPHLPARARATGLAVTTTSALVLVAACSVGGGDDPGSGTAGADASGTPQQRTVVVASHDSWNMSTKVLATFTRQTGYRVKVEPAGDVGVLTNKLVLTKGSPIADAVYGIDTTFASRAVEAGVLAEHSVPDAPASAAAYDLPDAASAARLTPVDFGDVCVNIDDRWFRSHDVAPPRTLDDLVKPAYRGLFVTPGAATSSPGLAFLLATVAKYGDAWPQYWKKLMANDTLLTAGWSDAYEVDFTAGGGKGSRPIVLSYASSPPFTVPEGGSTPTTSALLDTCFRQVEYAGVLQDAENPEGAAAFVDFMTRPAFQRALPDAMYVFPVDDQVALPQTWARFAKVAEDPLSVSPAEITRNRDAWLREWGDITTR